MKKSKNSNKQKYDKTNTQNKKQFRNRCLASDNNKIEATNQEIIDEIDTLVEKIPKLKKDKKIKENLEEIFDEESKNNSDENKEDVSEEDELHENDEEDEETPMSDANFNIKLSMIV